MRPARGPLLTRARGAARARATAARQAVTNLAERARRRPWPVIPLDRLPDRVGVAVVNYNGRDHIARLLFSLFRVLDTARLGPIVVVDNRSADGSLDLLTAFERAGLIELIRSDGPPYHGPGLNRALSHLAQRQTREPIRYVWVLDSDVIVLRPEALDAAVDSLDARRGALAGQLQFDVPRLLPEGYAHISAILVDPVQVWTRGVPPFLEHGAPGTKMQRRLRDRGAGIVDHPFFRDEYLLHLGLGTLRTVARDEDRRNRYYRWAKEMAGPGADDAHHFHGNPRGGEWFARAETAVEAEAPGRAPAALVEACLRSERVRL